jgi:hypothetical protein
MVVLYCWHVNVLLVSSRPELGQDVTIQPLPIPHWQPRNEVRIVGDQLSPESRATKSPVHQMLNAIARWPARVREHTPQLPATLELRQHFAVKLYVLLNVQEPNTIAPPLLQKGVIRLARLVELKELSLWRIRSERLSCYGVECRKGTHHLHPSR